MLQFARTAGGSFGTRLLVRVQHEGPTPAWVDALQVLRDLGPRTWVPLREVDLDAVLDAAIPVALGEFGLDALAR